MFCTLCNYSRNTCRGNCGACYNACCNAGCGQNVNDVDTVGNGGSGYATTAIGNGIYGIFFPISRCTRTVRRIVTYDCGNCGWGVCGNATNQTINQTGNQTTNQTTNVGLCRGCVCNTCTTNGANTVGTTLNGDAYYARQYGLYPTNGCGCCGN